MLVTISKEIWYTDKRNKKIYQKATVSHMNNRRVEAPCTVILAATNVIVFFLLTSQGMTEDGRIQIEKAITLIEKQYDLQIGEMYVESLGPGEKNTYFIVGPYQTESGLKMGLVVNSDINYTNIESRIKKHYDDGFFASKDLADCIVHEMAHVLTFQGCNTYEQYKMLDAKLDKNFVSGISTYADQSRKGSEALAEAFVKYRNGEKIPFRMKQLIKKYR